MTANLAKDSGAVEGIDGELCARDVRALTESHSVLPDVGQAADAPDLYTVVSQSGRTYTVDIMGPSCSCPDAEKRDVTCKHARRVMFAEGMRPIPGWVNPAAIDELLGRHVNGAPRIGKVATDGGPGLAADMERAGAGDERPADCRCESGDEDVPCWPCFRDGWETPAMEG